jgi:1-acyl-sn-glycerol-3-phosphate acyltransferase
MPLSLKRRVTFLAKAEYFTGKGLKGWAQRVFFAGSGQVPIDRTNASAAEDAILTGIRILRGGNLLGIYPEGTRSPDGRLYRGKTGVARLALEAGVPVLPVAMIGTDKVQPIGRRLPRIGRVGIVIGPPLDFSRYDGMEDDRFVLRSITDEIMYELMELSGQEYVDVYAATMKERIAAARRAPRPGARSPAGRIPAPAEPIERAEPAERVEPIVAPVGEALEPVAGAAGPATACDPGEDPTVGPADPAPPPAA